MSNQTTLQHGQDIIPPGLLDPGETALWWDRPNAAHFAMQSGLFHIFFALFFVGFSLFWMNGASQAGGYFWMFGLLFFGVGTWQLSEPLRRFLEAPKVLYVLTDKRALIVSPRKLRSALLSELRMIEVEANPKGIGDVLFMDPDSGSGWSNQDSGTKKRQGFIGIKDPLAVEREMRRLAGQTT